jgi:hypothetical protein
MMSCLNRIFPLLVSALLIGAPSCSSSPSSTDGGRGDWVAARARDQTARDRAALDHSAAPVVGALVELPLLTTSSSYPYNHSAETTIAVVGSRVAIASINMHFDSATSFGTTEFKKHVAVVVSSDDGITFGKAIDPGGGTSTTDPVIRASKTGTFWLSTWDTDSTGSQGTLSSSTDGATWKTAATLGYGDKEWVVVDDAGKSIYTGGRSGTWRISFDGTTLATESGLGGWAGGYVDSAGAHVIMDDFEVYRWNGSSAAVLEGSALDVGTAVYSGVDAGGTYLELNSCASIGATSDGKQWIVRTVTGALKSTVMLRVRDLPSSEGTDVPISTSGQLAFDPAAALDSEGRLDVVWYESSGSMGVLKYARSLSKTLTAGFSSPIVVDPKACPGGGWYPTFNSASGGRRLREYIDLAVEKKRVHVTYTHAPVAPSRVYYTSIDLP